MYNRNKFDEIFAAELLRVKRYKNSLSVAIIDIDKFKNFNDNFGHLIGDEVLTSMAKTVCQGVRETDERIFVRCDETLYPAKERGRNRVEVL